MPGRVLYRWKGKMCAWLAASMLLSGCTAAGVVPAATDTVLEDSVIQAEESLAEQSGIVSPALLWVVDEEHTLPRTYVPEDLTDIGNGQYLAQEAAEAYINLQRSLDIDGGEKLEPLAGYCSWEEQEARIKERARAYQDQGYDEERAATFASYDCGEPGSDPFQTGLCLRIVSPKEETEGWLLEHAAEYGFILQEEEEAWVLRYVGRIHAAAMKQLNVGFEGYMEYLSAYKSCVVILDQRTYAIERVSDLSLLSSPFLEVYGDNQGAYVVVRAQED